MEFTTEELANEEWRPVKLYEGSYEISNLGRVKALEKTRRVGTSPNFRTYPEKIMNFTVRKNDCLAVTLCKEGTNPINKYVHHLVLDAFVGERPEPKASYVVAHINGNNKDNRLSNLKWVNRVSIIRDYRDKEYNARALPNKSPVEELDSSNKVINTFESVIEASNTTGVSVGGIVGCCLGTIRTASNRRFKYLNPTTQLPTKIVSCYDDHGKRVCTYNHPWFAVQKHKTSSAIIHRCCTTDLNMTGGKLRWRLGKAASIEPSFPKWCKPLNQVDPTTNKLIALYRDSQEAGKAMNVAPSSITRAVIHNRLSCGYKWEYADTINGGVKKLVNFFIGRSKSKYATQGKEENQAAIIDLLESSGYSESSFLSMPNDGREIKAMLNYNLVNLSSSVGVESNTCKFKNMFIAFKRLLPGLRLQKGDINKYVTNTLDSFDVAHLDYNGVLKMQEYLSLEKLVNNNTLTFITTLDLNYHLNRYKLDNLPSAIDIREIFNNFNVIYENTYKGISKVPMITLGVVK